MNSKLCELCFKKEADEDYVCRTCKKKLCEDCITFCDLCNRCICAYSTTDWGSCSCDSKSCLYELICNACMEREASDPEMDEDPKNWKPATDSDEEEEEEEETEKV